MPDPDVDEVSGIRLVGGETRDTTDAPAPPLGSTVQPSGPTTRPAAPTALSALADAMLAAVPSTPRVLLVGLPAAVLAERLVAVGATVDLLVRSLDDARRLATPARTAAGGAGSVRVLAGVVDRYRPDDGYDVVLAPGGPTELRSPDSPDLGARGLLADLGALVRPGGLLLAGLPCPAGLGALLAPPARTGPAAWHRGAPGSRETPPGPDDAAHLAGMPLRATYGAWPSASAPRLLVTAGAAASARAAAAASWAGTTDTLRDPGAATWRAADAGLLDALAPGRLVVLGGPDDTALPAALDTVPPELAAREPLHDALDGHDVAAVRAIVHGLDDDALRAAAGAHLQRGLATPWGVTDAVTLTGHLLAMTGRGSVAAAAQPAEVGTMDDGAASEDVIPHPGDLAAADRAAPAPAPDALEWQAVAPSLAEARALVAELEAAVVERDAQVRWLEGTLRTREREIGVLERAVDVERSAAYRALRQLARPVPAARRRARRVLDRLTGPR